jgi:DNA-binding transcriptional LysR family regulator
VRLADAGSRADLIHTRLGRFTLVACAAPDYLAARGEPRTPAELAQHACLVQTGSVRRDTWRFERGGKWSSVAVRGPLRSNDVEALRHAARAGMGIAALPSFLADPDIHAGALRRVMPRFSGPLVDIFAVYPQRRHLPARVRAALDFLVRALRDVRR